MTEAADRAADELYGLAPGEFTQARDQRAKELRKEGDREAADEVKKLRKPTVAAWALNQLARSRRKEVDGLLAAGEELRAAQEELVAGGDRSAFQDAAANERELVARLAADATSLASEAGERGGGLAEKVAATLHAAALDEDTAEALRAGRLVREREAIGGFGDMAAGAAPAGRAPSRRNPAAGKPSRGRPSAGKPARGEAAPRRSADDAAAAARRERLSGARTDERHARRELEAAAKAVASAESRAEAAKAHAAEAAEQANKAAERAKTAADRLKEARRAETSARKAHARADKALADAERSAG